MNRVLTVDVGAGTMDVLYFDVRSGEHFKAVVKSPVASLAQEVERASGGLLILGNEMGGGAVSRAVKERARDTDVVMSLSASPTIHHDLDRVRSAGIRVVEDESAEAMAREGRHSVVEFGDLPIDRLREIVNGFDVPFAFDAVGVCAQDHGVRSQVDSQLDHRYPGAAQGVARLVTALQMRRQGGVRIAEAAQVDDASNACVPGLAC